MQSCYCWGLYITSLTYDLAFSPSHALLQKYSNILILTIMMRQLTDYSTTAKMLQIVGKQFSTYYIYKSLTHMISKIISKTIFPITRLYASSFSLLNLPRFHFGKVQKVVPIKTIIEDQIKAEKQHLNNLASYESEFNNGGWSMSREDTLVELQKKTGPYHIRLLSNIKPPSQFSQDEQKQNKKQQGQEQENNQGEMNEVTLCITKKGSEKTMVVGTLVTEGFEITSIHFCPSYKQAKKERMWIFNSNNYAGPQMESLSGELFQSIYSFIEQDLGVNTETMQSFADYCLESEQNFYIEWLKDLKAII